MKKHTNYVHLFANAKGIIIDTNLLLLFLVGTFDITKISSFKKTLKYSIDDYHKLVYLFNNYRENIFITQSIFTEVTNHLDTLNRQTNSSFFEYAHSFVSHKFIELNNSIQVILQVNKKVFLKLGFTDADIFNHANESLLVVTDDFELYQFLLSNNKPAINYNHLREMNIASP